MKAVYLAMAVLSLAVVSLAQGSKAVVKNDFLVNADTLSRGKYPWVRSAAGQNGNYVVVWADDRNGDKDIFARYIHASGYPIGPSFRVNDDTTDMEQNHPAVAMSPSGKFVIVWEDMRDYFNDYSKHIYAQRYGIQGKIGGNFRVNDEEARFNNQTHPVAAMNNDDGFVVVWEDDRNNYRYIYGHRFDSAGVSLGADFRIDDNPDDFNLADPTVGMDSSGRFTVAWSDRRGNPYHDDVYAKRYDKNGNQLGPEFRVNGEAIYIQQRPRIGMGLSGDFVIAWDDNRNSITYCDIYARRFDNTGAPQGNDFKVNTATGHYNAYSAVALDSAGNFTIAWDEGLFIYARRYDYSGTPLGEPFKVGQTPAGGLYNANDPSISMGKSGNCHIVFVQGAMYAQDSILAQRYNSEGIPQQSPYRIQDAMVHSWQMNPAVAMDRSGCFSVVWYDQYNEYYSSDIYLQRYNASGDTSGENVKVHEELFVPGRDQVNPAVAVAPQGRITVAYSELYNGSNIWMKQYEPSGDSVATRLLLSDSAIHQVKNYPAVAVGGNGYVAVAWEDQRNSQINNDTFDIYLQWIDDNGQLLGGNIRVNDDATIQAQKNVSLAMSHAGDLWAVWQDEREGDYDIYAQRYDATGAPSGANFRVNDDLYSAWQTMPSVARDSAGRVVVVWVDMRNGGHDIYGQRYDSDGSAIGGNFMINDNTPSFYRYNPSVACAPSGGRFVVCWTDINLDGDTEVMGQGFLDGSAAGSNFLVTEADMFYYNHQYTYRSNVAANDQLVAFTWTDNRRHKGYDVYAKLVDWAYTGVTGFPGQWGAQLSLQAYPNPFRSVMTLNAPVDGFVVYDVVGRRVAAVKGRVWNGRNPMGSLVPNGIYFIKAEGYKPLKVTVLR